MNANMTLPKLLVKPVTVSPRQTIVSMNKTMDNGFGAQSDLNSPNRYSRNDSPLNQNEVISLNK